MRELEQKLTKVLGRKPKKDDMVWRFEARISLILHKSSSKIMIFSMLFSWINHIFIILFFVFVRFSFLNSS